MKLLSNIVLSSCLLFALNSCTAQIKNTKTETLKIYGNCEMCQKTIETAGKKKKQAAVNWNKDTKLATVTYDSVATNKDEILKRIALSGYDSDLYLAPENTYNTLPGCCKYARMNKQDKISETAKLETNHLHKETSNQNMDTNAVNQMTSIFDSYFELKDALVATNGELASSKAKSLVGKVNGVKTTELTKEQLLVWNKINTELVSLSTQISGTKQPESQRKHFIKLSSKMYELIKTAKLETTTYYQFCPMANNGIGANWLSKETVIKNPYYGSQMLGCGNTVETIK